MPLSLNAEQKELLKWKNNMLSLSIKDHTLGYMNSIFNFL